MKAGQATAKYSKDGEGRELRFVLLIDEADRVMRYKFENLRNILKEGREFGVSVILSTQSIGDFTKADYGYEEQVLTWMIHQVPEFKQAFTQAIGLPDLTSQDKEKVLALEQDDALYKAADSKTATFLRGKKFYERNDWETLE